MGERSVADRRQSSAGSLIERIRRPFAASVGSIVFASNSRAVLLAGATGAVAAAVSMMAGAVTGARAGVLARLVTGSPQGLGRHGCETRNTLAAREATV
jgi:hypothetical protein